jgi:hypothetical protein
MLRVFVALAYVSIMPTLDYYGFEHENAITGVQGVWGFVCELMGFVFCGIGDVCQHQGDHDVSGNFRAFVWY